jgi:hypothetical protein
VINKKFHHKPQFPQSCPRATCEAETNFCYMKNMLCLNCTKVYICTVYWANLPLNWVKSPSVLGKSPYKIWDIALSSQRHGFRGCTVYSIYKYCVAIGKSTTYKLSRSLKKHIYYVTAQCLRDNGHFDKDIASLSKKKFK